MCCFPHLCTHAYAHTRTNASHIFCCSGVGIEDEEDEDDDEGEHEQEKMTDVQVCVMEKWCTVPACFCLHSEWKAHSLACSLAPSPH